MYNNTMYNNNMYNNNCAVIIIHTYNLKRQ